MEGLDTISYWYRSGRFIPSILPIPTHAISSSDYIDAFSDLILNSRLPVGLITLGVSSLPNAKMSDAYQDGLLRMRRLGVLLHLMHFTGDIRELHWVSEMQMEGIHLDMSRLRKEMLSSDVIMKIKKSSISPTQIYASNVGLVQDLKNTSLLGVDHCYGGLMMSPVSRHQMLQISEIGRAHV